MRVHGDWQLEQCAQNLTGTRFDTGLDTPRELETSA
jgi:hypothetical protein